MSWQWFTSRMVPSYTFTLAIKPWPDASAGLQRKILTEDWSDFKCFKGTTYFVFQDSHCDPWLIWSCDESLLAGWNSRGHGWRDTGERTITRGPEENKGTQCKTGNDKRGSNNTEQENTWPVCPLSGQQLGLIPPKYPKWTLPLRFSSRWH